MESVDVIEGTLLDDAGGDEVSLIGCDGQVLENEAVLELLVLLYHHHVLDSDSEFAVVVVSWLVGDAHAFNEFGGVTS